MTAPESMHSANVTHAPTNSCAAIARDRLFVVESSLMITLACFSLFVNGVFLSAVRHSTGHTSANVRALLFSTNVAIMIRSTYFIYRGFYLLLLTRYGFDRLAIPPLLCAGIELPYAVSSMCMITSLFAIGVERFATTVRKAKKPRIGGEHQDGVHKAVKAAIVLCWLQGLLIYSLMLTAKFATGGTAPPPLCYCVFPLVTKFYATAANNVYFGVQEIGILIAYFIIFIKSRHRLADFTLLTREHSLNDRYGVWTNVRTTRMLLPAATFHACIFMVVLFGGIPAFASFMASPTSGSLLVIVSLSFFGCIDGIAHPLLCVRFNERYRSVIGEKWPRLFWLFGAYRVDRRVAPTTSELPQAGPSTSPSPNGHVSSTPFSISVPSGHIGDVRMGDLSNSKTASSSTKQANRQDLNRLSKRTQTAGKKTIIDFRLNPDDHDAILNKMWAKYGAPAS